MEQNLEREVRFPEMMKALRLKKKLTQSEAAKGLGIRQSALSNYENGTSTPNVALLLEIAKFYGVPLDRLIYGSDEELSKKIVEDNQKLLIDLGKQMDFDELAKKYSLVVNGDHLKQEQTKRILEQIRFEHWLLNQKD